MRKLAIGTMLGASLALCACKDKSKTEGGAATTAAEAKKADSHVLGSKGSRLPAKGQSLTKEKTGEMKDAKMAIDAGPQKMEGTMNRNESEVESWVHVADNKARRTLDSKSVTSKMTLAGADQPTPEEKDALIGVPVIVEFKDGKYVATLESGNASMEQTKALEKLSDSLKEDSDFAMYGDSPRKVGDKWKVDPKSLGGFGEMKDMTGTFDIEFVEIKDFQGVPCAVLKSNFDVSGSAAAGDSDEGGKMTMKLKGEALSHRSLADKVDLEAKITSTMTMDGSPAPEVKMHVEGPFNMTTKTKVKK